MKSFELKTNYQIPVSIGTLVIVCLLATRLSNESSFSIWWWIFLVLIVLSIAIGVFRVFHKEKVIIDESSITVEDDTFAFIKKKIDYQNIDRIICFKDHLFLSNKQFQKNYEKRRFSNNEWSEFVALLKKLPQFSMQ